jgi:hypothetical protein
MAVTNAIQIQIKAILVSQLKMERTCSLIRRVNTSQLPRWKYGKLQRWNSDDKKEREKARQNTYDRINYLK